MTFDLHIATDGSCIQSGSFRSGSNEEARPGAWAYVGRYADGRTVKAAEPLRDTTIGAMEVTALLKALEFAATQDLSHVLIQCDSQYVVKGFNEWVMGWASKNFTKKGGLAHSDLWRSIHQLKQQLGSSVTVEWIRAHQNAGGLNDLADELANTSARTQVKGDKINLRGLAALTAG